MNPALLPDEELERWLADDLTISLLFPLTTVKLVFACAEYTHRFGVVHRATSQVGRAARLFDVRRGEDAFTEDDYCVDELIALWRVAGVSWTRRRPPHWLPKEQVLHVPAPGTKYHWDNVGHETYRYKYKVLRACSDAIIMQDLDRTCAVVAPTYDRLREYVSDGPVQMQYVFGVRPCGWYSPA